MKSTKKPLHGSKNSSNRGASQTAPLIPEASLKSTRENSMATPNATSLLELRGGVTPCNSPTGQATDLFGQDLAPANHSAPQGNRKPKKTNGTYGRRSSNSSNSVALSLCLGSKLRTLLGMVGSTEYRQTWKVKTTPAGRRYWAHIASRRTIQETGFIGLPTPSGTSNHGKNHSGGRMDEWGGSSNPFRGTEIGKIHCPAFEFWVMGYPAEWMLAMPPVTPSFPKRRQLLS